MLARKPDILTEDFNGFSQKLLENTRIVPFPHSPESLNTSHPKILICTPIISGRGRLLNKLIIKI
jgi:hypothetical protein